MHSYYEMANLIELVIPVMLYSVQHRFVQGHLPSLSVHIFWIMGLKESKQPCAAYLMSSPGKLPCEMLPSCDNKPEQPNAATFGL